jgi:hypothetical protein
MIVSIPRDLRERLNCTKYYLWKVLNPSPREVMQKILLFVKSSPKVCSYHECTWGYIRVVCFPTK